jgi:hypothetical protein
MELWDKLSVSVLLGSERSSFEIPKIDGDLGEALSRLDAPDPESALLSAAAVISAYREAGTRPPVDESAGFEPAPEIDLPECGPRASRLLERLLAEKLHEVLPDWLEACAAAGRRVEARLLPDLLEQGSLSAKRRHAIMRVLGGRGVWLAKRNSSKWAWAFQGAAVVSSTDPQEIFRLGSKSARPEALRTLRETDPAAALALLAQSWKQESADERAAFAEALEIGLSPADEPFLEAALSDRSQGVRQVAADLLARLPASALAQRASARAREHVTLQQLEGVWTLEAKPPHKLSDEMKRDGIQEESTRGQGKRAHWLFQIVAAAPLDCWTAETGLSPAQAMEAVVREKDWAGALRAGFAWAACRQKRSDWARAILTPPGGVANDLWMQTIRFFDERALADVLSPQDFEACVLALLEKEHGSMSKLVTLLHEAKAVEDHSMSEKLALALWERLREDVLQKASVKENVFYELAGIKNLGRFFPVSLADPMSEWLRQQPINSYYSNTLHQVASALQLRREISEAFV